MTQVNMHEAKTHLSRLVERALDGEEVVIAKSGKPAVRLAPVEPKTRPPFGFAKGTFAIAPDAFAPMTDEELDMWEK